MDELFDKIESCNKELLSINSKLFTNISHDLKTPINVIFSSIQLMDSYRKSLDCEAYKAKSIKHMNIIRQNCYRIMRLTNNLIDMSCHDNGFLKIKLTNYDIVKLIKHITLSVKRYAETKKISLSFESDIESKIIACDLDIIERIVLNLISNAIKYTDEDGYISIKLFEKEGNIFITVKDTGVGIPENKLHEIFELFGQGENGSSIYCEGSGIGLYLVKVFVEAHGGEISVSSKVGEGSSFVFSLPIYVIDQEPPQDLSKMAKRNELLSNHVINRINIEFSDIYSCFDYEEDIL